MIRGTRVGKRRRARFSKKATSGKESSTILRDHRVVRAEQKCRTIATLHITTPSSISVSLSLLEIPVITTSLSSPLYAQHLTFSPPRATTKTCLSTQITLEIESEPPVPQISTAKADKERERHKTKDVNLSKKIDGKAGEAKEKDNGQTGGDED